MKKYLAIFITILLLFGGTALAGLDSPTFKNISSAPAVGPASTVSTDTTNFNNNLSIVDDTSQKAFDTLDDMAVGELIITDAKTANYNANANEWVLCNVTSGSFSVNLPDAPANNTRVRVSTFSSGASVNVLTIAASGSDTFATPGGETEVFANLGFELYEFQYISSIKVWMPMHSAPPATFATNFPGIDALTPLDNDDISINTTSRILTITPPLGYFYIITDGDGRALQHRKEGNIDFPTFTDTSGTWFFYFDQGGTAVTTQTPWNAGNFATIAPVYRIYWNATETGADKLVDELVEYHQNTISADDHIHKHLEGSIHASGGDITTNAITSGSPNADGSETVIAMTTNTNIDDNLLYTVTNDSTPTLDWEQDLGDTNAGTLDSTNSGQFEIFVQDGAGLVTYLPATRFPFDWGSGDDIPQYISSTGVRTDITQTYYFVYFIYANQNPRVNETLRLISAPSDYETLEEAEAVTWVDIQNTYSIIANDGEIRPMHRLIFQARTSASPYPQAAKYTALRETQDIRKAAVTNTTTASGSIAATSVIVTPTGNIASTNAQSALAELDSEKLTLAGISGGQTANGGTGSGENLTLESTSNATKGSIEALSSFLLNTAGQYFNYYPNGAECSDGEILEWTASNHWECAAAPSGGGGATRSSASACPSGCDYTTLENAIETGSERSVVVQATTTEPGIIAVTEDTTVYVRAGALAAFNSSRNFEVSTGKILTIKCDNQDAGIYTGSGTAFGLFDMMGGTGEVHIDGCLVHNGGGSGETIAEDGGYVHITNSKIKLGNGDETGFSGVGSLYTSGNEWVGGGSSTTKFIFMTGKVEMYNDYMTGTYSSSYLTQLGSNSVIDGLDAVDTTAGWQINDESTVKKVMGNSVDFVSTGAGGSNWSDMRIGTGDIDVGNNTNETLINVQCENLDLSDANASDITVSSSNITNAVVIGGDDVLIESSRFGSTITVSATADETRIGSTNVITGAVTDSGTNTECLAAKCGNAGQIWTTDGTNATWQYLQGSHQPTDPCGIFPEGTFYYNSTDNFPCYCSVTATDLKFSDDTDCI